MKQLFFYTISMFIAGSLPAQDLHIYCDAFTDSVYFMRKNRSVEKAIVRKGDQVILHVKNYNSYLYSIDLKTDDSNLTVSQGSFGKGFAGASGGSNPFSMLLKSVGGSFPVLPLLGGGSLDDTHGYASTVEEAEANKIKKIETSLKNNLNLMQQTNAELTTLEEKINDELNSQKLKAFSSMEIKRLRYDPNLEPKHIKRLAMEYAEQLFDESDPEKLTLNYVLQKGNMQAKLEGLVLDYRKRVKRYQRFKDRASSLNEALMLYSIPESNLAIFVDSTHRAVDAAAEKLESFQYNLEKVEAISEGPNNFDPSRIAELRSNYISFMANDFSKTYRQIAKGDNLNLSLRLTPVDSALYLGARSKTLPPIPVKVYGGIRVNTSIGIGFAKYFEQPKDYFVRDSMVFSSNKDAFSPVISTFIHFYSPKPGSISWGGSFGVGIPLGGDNNLQAISFFLGPSIVIGQNHDIVFTGGLSGGKVPKPAQGYQVGDSFNSDPSFFATESKYALGYFLGVSFNLLGK